MPCVLWDTIASHFKRNQWIFQPKHLSFSMTSCLSHCVVRDFTAICCGWFSVVCRRCRKQLTLVLARRLTRRHIYPQTVCRASCGKLWSQSSSLGQLCRWTYCKHITVSPAGMQPSLIAAQIDEGEWLSPFIFLSLSQRHTGGLMGRLTSVLSSWHV